MLTIALEALNYAVLALFLVLTNLGFGNHIQRVPPTHLIPILKISWIITVVCCFVSLTYRVAACFLYLRVFGANRTFSICTLVIIAIVIFGYLVELFLFIFYQCNPVRKAWDVLVPGTCNSMTPYYQASVSGPAVLDVIILILPLPMIKSLNLTRSQKFWLAFSFFWGYCVALLGFIRTYFFIKWAWVLDFDDPDFPWNASLTSYTILPDAGLAIFGLCSPPIYQLCLRARRYGVRALLRSTEGSITENVNRDQESASQIRPSEIKKDTDKHLVQRNGAQESSPTKATFLEMSSIHQGWDTTFLDDTGAESTDESVPGNAPAHIPDYKV
ncbi:MAG: hypothetical protein M1828_003927 [Chrysothrix sp. TS-e1954]|nr:MAG: hypothetical protein M1828_003927 [Chrysothrix sp. TS-e1954]